MIDNVSRGPTFIVRKAVFCNNWRRKILFAKEKEKKENILRRKIDYAEDKKNRRERRKIFRKGKFTFCTGEGIGAKYLEKGNIFLQRRKIFTASIADSSVKFFASPTDLGPSPKKQKRHICRKRNKYAPDESFVAVFALTERLPTSATLPIELVTMGQPTTNFL